MIERIFLALMDNHNDCESFIICNIVSVRSAIIH